MRDNDPSTLKVVLGGVLIAGTLWVFFYSLILLLDTVSATR